MCHSIIILMTLLFCIHLAIIYMYYVHLIIDGLVSKLVEGSRAEKLLMHT